MKINREQLKEIIVEEIRSDLGEQVLQSNGANVYDVYIHYVALSKTKSKLSKMWGDMRRTLLTRYGGEGILARLKQPKISNADYTIQRKVDKEMIAVQNKLEKRLAQGHYVKSGMWRDYTLKVRNKNVIAKKFLIMASSVVGDKLADGYYKMKILASGVRANSPKEVLNKTLDTFVAMAEEENLLPPDTDIGKELKNYSVTDLKTKKVYKGKLT